MGTHASISVFHEDKFHTIYCHYDGYPSGIGCVLETFYCDKESALELIEGGDVSFISKTTGDAAYYALREGWARGHGFVEKNEKWENVRPRAFESFRMMSRHYEDVMFRYLFKNNEWRCYRGQDAGGRPFWKQGKPYKI